MGIILPSLLTAVVSLAAIVCVLQAADAAGWHRAGALMSVPLGWLKLHTLFTFRYAHLWYARMLRPTRRAARSSEAWTSAAMS